MTERSEDARLAAFIADTRPQDLSSDVYARAARVLADTMAVIAAGMQEPEMQALLSGASEVNDASILGANRRAEPGMAAFLNASAGVFLELDEGAARSRGHPAIHVAPPLLAWAEAEGGDGERLLHALVLGYEVATRVGHSANLRPAMHPHGVWGLIGGAVALAVYDGAGGQEILETMRVSASLMLATSRPTMLEGATVRNAYSGFAGQHAVMIRRMVKAGFTGDEAALEVVLDRVIGSNWRAGALDAGLGGEWAIMDGYFKRHACCRFNHAALDALADLRAAHPGAIAAENVERIRVEAYALATELDDPAPDNMLAAKFSLPFALATSVIREGDTWLDAFRGPAIHAPETRSLAARTTLAVDPEFEALAPDRRPVRVIVDLLSGERLEQVRMSADGDPDAPFSDADLDDKFLRLLAPIVGHGKAARALEAALNADQADDVSDITALFQPDLAAA